MSDDNNNNDNNNNKNDNNDNNNDNNKNITLKPREINDLSLNNINNINLSPIDNSNNKIFRTWKINPIINPNLLLLDTCKEKNLLLSKNSKDIIKKNQLNINNVNKSNMTINKVIDNIKERRQKNNKERFNKYKDFIKQLDEKEKLEKNLLLEDKKKENENANDLNSILEILNKKVDFLERNNSIFGSKDDTALFPIGRHRRRSSIYIPSTRIEKPIEIKKTKVNIEVEIDSLDDLLKLINDYPLKYDVEYNINMKAMHNIKEPLINLQNMIGMNKLKNNIVDQILYFVQNLHKGTDKNHHDFMHTVIYGPPGTGKTETAKIMGSIFSKLGILKRKTFKKATRADLIAGYLGQTAIKTRDMIKECLGGVLFIDEAYALGNPEKRDSFAKECIDTLCEGLSDHKEEIMVIIAGYEEELKNCFFSYNQGLDSRFTWRFSTDDYTYKELFLIFKKKVNEIGWKLNKKVKDGWFEDKMDYFKFYGRDIETLLAKIKIAHGRRVFCLPEDKKKSISLKDMQKGFDMFLDNNEVKNRKDDSRKNLLQHIYI
tara:strand:+ start:2836 stop:4470 length:1635 start_codon:yes stop_codon:yes gene_type:complete